MQNPLNYENKKSYKGRIGSKLVLTFVLFVTIFVGSSGFFLYRSSKNSLDNELGAKLVAIAQAVTTQIDEMFITQLSPGDENTLTYENLFHKLNNVKNATDVKKIYIFDRNNRSIVDTDRNVLIGTEYIRLKFDKYELQSLWNGKSVYTVLFKGNDGVFYKSGYAPIKTNGSIVAAVGVDTSATFMNSIQAFGRNVIIFSIISIIMTVIIGFLFSKTITQPIEELVKIAEDIGKGNFDNEVHINTNDELGYLGNAMESMRKGIIDRDNRLKMMLAGVAHEIRNPLGGIEIFAGLLAEDLEGIPKEHVGKIIKEVRNLNEIVTQFLEYARPAEPVIEAIQLSSLIDDTLFLLSPEFQKRNIKFKSSNCDAKIYVDPKQIKRVFMNIFKNAIQVMPDGGDISLLCKANENFIDVSISNNGPAIPKENIDKIFDPFWTTKEKGVGLGLAIVKKLVDDNNGKISVKSEANIGTIFTIALPITKEN